jgi:hypothetical protein
MPLGQANSVGASGRNAGPALCGDFLIFNFYLIFWKFI